jgi:hypothetical protein
MKRIAAVLLVSGVLAALSSNSYALGIPGNFGYSFNQSNCFGLSSGAIENFCSGTALIWYIPLSVNSGGHTVTVSGTNNSGGLYCMLISTTQTGQTYQDQSRNFPSGTNTVQLTATVPNSGSLLVECGVGQNDLVNSVNYSQ